MYLNLLMSIISVLEKNAGEKQRSFVKQRHRRLTTSLMTQLIDYRTRNGDYCPDGLDVAGMHN